MSDDPRTEIEKFLNIPKNLPHDDRIKFMTAKLEELQSGSIQDENEFLAHTASAKGIRLTEAIIHYSIAQSDAMTEVQLMRYAEHMGISLSELKQCISVKLSGLQ